MNTRLFFTASTFAVLLSCSFGHAMNFINKVCLQKGNFIAFRLQKANFRDRRLEKKVTIFYKKVDEYSKELPDLKVEPKFQHVHDRVSAEIKEISEAGDVRKECLALRDEAAFKNADFLEEFRKGDEATANMVCDIVNHMNLLRTLHSLNPENKK